MRNQTESNQHLLIEETPGKRHTDEKEKEVFSQRQARRNLTINSPVNDSIADISRDPSIQRQEICSLQGSIGKRNHLLQSGH